ncbi:MAG: carboxypeptidase-like regulatory domain-containing protein, partial [Bacteroidales bacterium]|nr:carboxypeptidase-like regulatory domain-containing protein [Bacteroidales bacterium]
MKVKKLNLLKGICITLLCAFSLSVNAQNITVKGTVTDAAGEPLIGVTVQVQGTITGTATDLNGQFTLPNVPSDATLLITYVGMLPQTIQLNGRTALSITMLEDTELLEEVIVVGYGQQKKVSVVGAIVQTTDKVLERTGGITNLGQALTGNLPGVVTMTTTGKPGEEDPEITIRGVSSWNDSGPLVLVDGVERPMSGIDINSVATISVLKDASATAVFGVRGANGVILI